MSSLVTAIGGESLAAAAGRWMTARSRTDLQNCLRGSAQPLGWMLGS